MRIRASGWCNLAEWLCAKGGCGLISPWSCSMEELRHFLSCCHWYLPQLELSSVRASARGGSGKGWMLGMEDTPQLAAASAAAGPFPGTSQCQKSHDTTAGQGSVGTFSAGRGYFRWMPVCGVSVWLQPID